MSKKPKDVITAGVAIFAALILTGWIAKCAYADAVVETGFAYEIGDTFGRNPVGVVRVQFEIFENIYADYEHHSSIPDENDRNSYDAISIIGRWPFGKKIGGCRYGYRD